MTLNKSDKRLVMFAIIIVLFSVIGLGSAYFWKDDNFVENAAEEVVSDTIELALALPDEDVKNVIKVTPDKCSYNTDEEFTKVVQVKHIPDDPSNDENEQNMFKSV